MTSVAEALGKSRLGYTDKHRLIESIPKLRSMGMDRAILRAMHFFDEQRRVVLMCEALIAKTMSCIEGLWGRAGYPARPCCKTYALRTLMSAALRWL